MNADQDARVIAYYRPVALFRAVGVLAIVGAVYALSLFGETGASFKHFLTDDKLFIPLAVMAWLAGLTGIWFPLVIIELFLFGKRKAIWIERHSLVYANRWNLAADCNSVSKIYSGISNHSHRPCVFIELVDGKRKVIPTVLLVETPDTIVARLRRSLASG